MTVPMISFSVADEFLNESRHLKSRIVRVTILQIRGAQFSTVSLFLVAGFVDYEGRLVELAEYCGETTGDPMNLLESLYARRDSLIEQIEQRGHLVRSGRYRLEQNP